MADSKQITVKPHVSLIHGQAKTTTIDIAKVFKKRHDTVLRSISRLDCSPEFTHRNFAVSEYKDDSGRTVKMYEVTRNGFVFLVMGFTGKDAARFKEAYINEFDRMETQIRNHYSLPPDTVKCLSSLVEMIDTGNKAPVNLSHLSDLVRLAKGTMQRIHTATAEFDEVLQAIVLNIENDIGMRLERDETEVH